MTTYNTILEAFRNGTGDHFYTKENKFIAVSRKSDNRYLEKLGFTFMTYEEIVSTDKAQKALNPEPVKIIEVKPIEVKEKSDQYFSRRHSNISSCQSYYEEFPDAYNQSL